MRPLYFVFSFSNSSSHHMDFLYYLVSNFFCFTIFIIIIIISYDVNWALCIIQ